MVIGATACEHLNIISLTGYRCHNYYDNTCVFPVCASSLRSSTCRCHPTWLPTTSTSSRQSRRSAWGWRSWRWTSTSGRSRRTTRVSSVHLPLGNGEVYGWHWWVCVCVAEMMQSLAQRPAQANTNRERRPRYQHPKGAPNADLIFKTGGRSVCPSINQFNIYKTMLKLIISKSLLYYFPELI